MKVAHMLGTFPKISETFILNQISGIIDEGNDVHIFARKKPEHPAEHGIIDEYSLMEKVTYIERPRTYLEGARVLGTAVPYLLINGFGIRNTFSEFRYGKSTPRHLADIRSFYESGEDFDVHHAHFGPVANSYLGVRKIGAPLVVSFYGWDTGLAPGADTRISDELFDEAKVVTCLSEDMRDDLVNMGCPRDKTRKVPLCTDTENFRYKERDIEPDEPVRILTVARFAEKKGLKYAVRAIAELDLEREIRYSIAGDGERRSQIENLIEEVGVEDRIDLLGWQSQEQVSELMSESHLFLLPSVTTESGGKEGTPTVLLEAQAAGLPVVSTYHAGIPEIVDDGNAGILVPERDVESLTEALEELSSSPKRWSGMGRKGREYVEKTHSIDAVTDRILEVYESVS